MHHFSPSSFNSTRIARFGRGGVILRGKSDPLELEQIGRAAPSVLASDKHASRSERYTYIPTIDVLRGLQREGFEPFEVRQGGSGDVEKRAFTKHMIRLRQRGSVMVGDSFREIILINSHDGTSSYQLMAGMFRLVCSNGLIIGDGELRGVRIPHKGDIVSNVIDGAFTVVDETRQLDARVSDMRALELRPAEQEAFAEAAGELRFDGGAPVTPTQLLGARRPDDRGADLWRTFNRVQENLERGGVSYVQRDERGRRIARRETRPVQSIDGSVSLNRALWTLAQRMQELKAA
jgi:hypothetical protein